MADSFIRNGTQNKLDLSWNKPINNGNTIKNYFFYVEDRTIIETPVISYYSYALPTPNIANFGSNIGNTISGFDINSDSHLSTNIYTLKVTTGFSNFFDLTYGGDIELNWFYHPDVPIVDICANTGTLTKMTINIFKEDSTNNINTRRYLVDTIVREYNSTTNKLGPTPLNNYPFIIKDIFSINTDISGLNLYKKFNKTDKFIFNVSIYSLSYNTSTSTSVTDTRTYSIIIKDCKFAPYRLPFSQRFTSLSFWNGTTTGLLLNKNNALSPLAGNDTSGCIYYMPKMINIMKKYEKATISFSWSYDFDLSMSATDLSFCGITDVSSVSFPYSIRIRGYSRPFSNSAISDNSYNTTSIHNFISNSTNTNYNTYSLFDISRNYTAGYNHIKKDLSNNYPLFTHTIDLSGLSFPLIQSNLDDPTHHSQFVFIVSLYLNTNLPIYNLPSNKLFSVRYLSYTFTPYQYYHFSGPDPTLFTSNELTSPTRTVYDITNLYDDIIPYYSIYNLINGTEYAIKIAANNINGTTNFSSLYATTCGSVPNRIYSNNYLVESYNQNKQISLIWDKPRFSGYEITKYRIEYSKYESGKWLNLYDFEELIQNDISFNIYKPIDISNNVSNDILGKFTIINQTDILTTYRYLLNIYEIINPSSTGPLINGIKYYVHIAAYNHLGFGEYSPILNGIPISIPDLSNGIVTFPRSPIAGYYIANGNYIPYISFTWTVPIDDAGAPILDYLIEYAMVTTDGNDNVIISAYQQYYQDNVQPEHKLDLYKNIIVNKNVPTNDISLTKNLLQTYLIPPTPISLYEVDKNNINIINNPSLSKYIDISNANITYTYISSYLEDNEFDLSNIQLKLYYLQDISNGTSGSWGTILINFKISIKAYVLDSNNIPTSIFSFPPPLIDLSYNVTDALLSGTTNNYNQDSFLNRTYKYINIYTGQDISLNTTPQIFTSQLTRINSTKRLRIDISATNLTGTTPINSKLPKFNIRVAPIILNGVMPIRTSPDLKTTISYTISSNLRSTLIQNALYSFRIRPFNISDYFRVEYTDEVTSTIIKYNRFEYRYSYTLVDEITSLLYILQSDSSIKFYWKYNSTSQYKIVLSLTNTDTDYNRIEYLVDGNTQSSFSINYISPDSNNVVNFNIPDLKTDPNNFLRAGRSYTIGITAIKLVEQLDRSFISIYSTSVYNYNIIPFTIPLRPISAGAQGGNGKITLNILIPNIVNDPNYYITDLSPNYYKYKYILIEYKNANDFTWETKQTQKLLVTYPDNLSETIQTVDISNGITNEINYNIRLSMGIYNDYNNQEIYSNYTYPSFINNITYPELSGNFVYASIYPYKSSTIQNLNVGKYSYSNIQIEMSWYTPSYNGNAVTYIYTIQYSTNSNPTVWYDIYDTINGIANITDGSNSTGPIPNIATINTPITFILTCKSYIQNYNMRVSAIGYVTPSVLNPTVNRRAISEYSTVATIIL